MTYVAQLRGDAGAAVVVFLQRMVAAFTPDDVLAMMAEFAGTVTGTDPQRVVVEHRYDPTGVDLPDALVRALAERRPVLVDEHGPAGPATVAAFPVESYFEHPTASLTLRWGDRVALTDDEVQIISVAARAVCRVMDRQIAIIEGRIEVQRAQEIAALAVSLARAATLDQVLGRLVDRAGIPLGAAGIVVGLVDSDAGVLHRHFGDLLPEAIAAPLASEPLDADSPLVRAATTGGTELFADREAVVARAPGLLDAFDATGWVAYAAVPLLDIGGAPFGALGVGWERPVAFDPPMLAALTTVSELVSQAVQRTQMVVRLEADALRHRRLADFSRRLAMASTPEDVEETLLESVLGWETVTGARFAWYDPTGLGAQPRDIDGRPDPTVEGDPAHRIVHEVRTSDGRPIGELTIDRTGAARLERASIDVLTTGVELLASTMQRVALSNAEHSIISDLQGRVLVAPEAPPGLAVATTYRPASQVVAMGGDWHQALVLPDGRLGVVVGDVVGHGAMAAIDMTQLAGITATLLRLGTPLDQLLDLLAAALPSGDVMATLAICKVDPARGVVRYVSAGHPPMLLVGPGGAVQRLEGSSNPMFGVPAGRRMVAEAPFERGATVLAYTDGLVERRGEDLGAGIERAEAALAAAVGLPAAELIDAVVAGCTDGVAVDDDIAAVAVQALAGPG